MARIVKAPEAVYKKAREIQNNYAAQGLKRPMWECIAEVQQQRQMKEAFEKGRKVAGGFFRL